MNVLRAFVGGLLFMLVASSGFATQTGCVARECHSSALDAMRDDAEETLDCPAGDIGYGTTFDGYRWAEGCGRVAHYACSGRRTCYTCEPRRVVQY